jgi:hypothetical protein
VLRIEVAALPSAPGKNKGDVLERLARILLETQNYNVTEQVRITGSELDLLCEHPVSGRTILVECKAHRDPLSATALKVLHSTVIANEYDEGWLISTGPLGKDAKGWQRQWESKPRNEKQRISIYTPGRLLAALLRSRTIKSVPDREALELIGAEDELGGWTLLLTPAGIYWLLTCLESGEPAGVVVFYARTGALVNDSQLLNGLARTDTSLRGLDFEWIALLDRRSTAGGAAPDRLLQIAQDLRRFAADARDCGKRLNRRWCIDYVNAALGDFSWRVDRAVQRELWQPGSGDAPLQQARQRLRETLAWLQESGWLKTLMSDAGCSTLREFRVVRSVLLRVCGKGDFAQPESLDVIARNLLSSSACFVGADEAPNAREICRLLAKHLSDNYSEETVTATVAEGDGDGRFVCLSIESMHPFQTFLPAAAFDDDPTSGDKYTVVLWDLWRRWCGIACPVKTFSFRGSWTRELREKYIRTLPGIE